MMPWTAKTSDVKPLRSILDAGEPPWTLAAGEQRAQS